jgi:glycosyltransferase involved in cell wall biosynthesis
MRVSVIVPCYNEEKRLRPLAFAPLFARGEVVFAENGSTDGALPMLRAFCESEPRARVLALGGVGGKGEAVRLAMRDALRRGADVVGFLDADEATPAPEMLRIVDEVLRGAQAAIGVRVEKPGARIERPFVRRVLGRIFARAAACTLGVRLRDTQCGAKAFRGGPALDRALAAPFSARWAFDVELLGRLFAAGVSPTEVREVELGEWRHVKGSKLKASDFPRMVLELASVRRALRRARM